MKFTQKMHQSVTFQATSSTCSCLYSFPPNKKKSEQLDERSSITSAHKLGWRLGGGVEAGGWRGGWGVAGRLGGGGEGKR